jgi:hypothetical protein
MYQKNVLIIFATAVGLTLNAGDGVLSARSVAMLNPQRDYLRITRQPEDQAIWRGSRVTFAVSANNGERFQWLRNGVALGGQTNSTLNLMNVTVSDVGLYSCRVIKGVETVSTRSATLNMLDGGGDGSITIFGTPLLGSGGQGSDCPGPYVGYVNFIKPASQGWGWAPTVGAPVHSASDPNRTDTHLIYNGRLGDSGCGATTVEVNPVVSPKYRFAVFFPSDVPAGVYSLILTGFNP